MFCHSERLQSHPTRLKQFSLTVPNGECFVIGRGYKVALPVSSSFVWQSLVQLHLALSFRFNVCSAAKRGTQTLQRLIRVPQLARDGIVVLADLR